MKWIIRGLLIVIVSGFFIFFLYCNNLSLSNKQTVRFYKELKTELKNNGFRSGLLVISTKRFSLHNRIQVRFSGAASKSRHLGGDAIDFLVFDVNKDGKRNAADVDIVYKILDEQIMKGKGGIGTYKNERSFINRQMIHIDCREGRSRWSR